jgi:hypothetical protein
MTVNVPDELAERLAAEAARRGQTVDAVAAELLAAGLEDPLAAFIGCGSSGNDEPFELREARRDLAERKLAEGA